MNDTQRLVTDMVTALPGAAALNAEEVDCSAGGGWVFWPIDSSATEVLLRAAAEHPDLEAHLVPMADGVLFGATVRNYLVAYSRDRSNDLAAILKKVRHALGNSALRAEFLFAELGFAVQVETEKSYWDRVVKNGSEDKELVRVLGSALADAVSPGTGGSSTACARGAVTFIREFRRLVEPQVAADALLAV
jgi:hypothetical protein